MSDTDWIKEFAELYFNSDPEKRCRGSRLLIEHRPKKFYRYLNVNNTNRFFRDGRPWHSNLNVYVNSEGGDKNEGRWYKFNRDIVPDDKIWIIDYFEGEIDLIRSIFKTASFTTSPLNKMMWNEFADNSKGVCIEYDSEFKYSWLEPIEYRLCDKIFPIIYTEKPVDLTEYILDEKYAKDPQNIVNAFSYLILLLKNAQYKEEDEWRSIQLLPEYGNPNLGYVGFAPSDISTEQLMELDDKQRELNNSDDSVLGGPADFPVIPKSIYLGEHIDPELETKVIDYAERNSFIDVYKIKDSDTNPRAELIPKQTH